MKKKEIGSHFRRENETRSIFERWEPVIERALADAGHGAWRVVVVRETTSTQDDARREGFAPGTVVAAWHQSAGRGRMGRSWHDPGGKGIAVTFVTGADRPPEGLALAPAVGAAEAVERLLGRPCTLKWPNDVLVDGRKLAGILIERSGPTAWIGVGLNVSQTSWPEALAGRAVSLKQLGLEIDRLDVLASLVPAVIAALGRDLAALQTGWGYRTADASSRPRPGGPIQATRMPT